MASRLTAKQCRASRALLNWNISDLASRVNVPLKRLDSFEKNILHLHQPENTEVMNVFKKEGIEFLSDFEVRLRKNNKQAGQMPFIGSVGLGDNAQEGQTPDSEEPIVYVATDHYVDRTDVPYRELQRPLSQKSEGTYIWLKLRHIIASLHFAD